jgi:predicted metal-binding protein
MTRGEGLPMAESAPPHTPDVCVHVCVTCKAGTDCPDAAERPGLKFRRALDAAVAAGQDDHWLAIREVSCLALCDHGCSAAISTPGKWSYLLGRLSDAKAADFITYARSYRASRTGVVLPSKRPASLHDTVLGRMPSLAPAREISP